MRRALLPVVIALVMMLPFAAGVPTASAVVVTLWDYTVNAGFSAFGPGSVIASQPGSLCSGASCPPSTFYNTRLEWGTPIAEGGNLRSALQLTEPASSITPPAPGILGAPMVTDGPTQPGINITHENHVVLDNGNTLSTATIAGRLTLKPNTPSLPSLQPFDTNFSIRFKETLNVGPCLGGTSVCDDIFVLDNVNTPFGPVAANAPLVFPFSIGGDAYTLRLDLLGLGPLTAAQCAAAGAAAGCFGFLTPENANTTLQTRLSIQSANIPEPSTLLLLGTGLAALSLYTRKKAKQRMG